MADVVDTSSFDAGIIQFAFSVGNKTRKDLQDIATEILRLSQLEVPHDQGTLQNSGAIEDGPEENMVTVGYNTVYAAYQHEGARADGSHPIHAWQAGRKGKYLEDPIRNNLGRFKDYFLGVFT